MDAMEKTAAEARRLSIRTADRGDEIELTVADRGSGIDPAQRDKVFDSFYTTKPQGMGLGLSIARAIVEAHEGQISVQARKGGGTVFCVRLPRRLAVASATLPAVDAEAGTPRGSALTQNS
jgi:two-component system sensor histidine kinase DctS